MVNKLDLADFWSPPKSETFSLLIIVHIETQKVKVLRANQKNDKLYGSYCDWFVHKKLYKDFDTGYRVQQTQLFIS